jgi:hypothetical protein
VNQDRKVSKANRDLLGLKVPLDRKANKVYKVCRVNQAHRASKACKVSQERKVQKVLLDLLMRHICGLLE